MKSFQAINNAVLTYAVECATSGDTKALRDIGLSKDNLKQIEDMSLSDLNKMTRSPGHILTINVDNDAFSFLIRQIKTEKRKSKLLYYLVKADAPYALMNKYFGMQRPEYIAARDAFDMNNPERGRTSLPTEKEESVIADQWYKTVENPKDPTSIDFLKVHTTTGLSVRVIWVLYQNWINNDMMENDHASHR